MNVYARYFDHEILTRNLDELLDFLHGLREVPITPALVNELRDYYESDLPYPKRCKVRPRIYFILIKTTAETMQEFKSNRKPGAKTPQPTYDAPRQTMQRPVAKSLPLQETQGGWYFSKLHFKRVMLIPGTNKHQYRDTTFSAYLRANSPQHCYERIIDHLKNRQDIDPRSQFPSPKGANFHYEYIGEQLR